MSELIAEARVLVVPDTTTFRSLLTAQLTTATAGITVPVNVVPGTAGTAGASRAVAEATAGAAASSAALAQQTNLATDAALKNRLAMALQTREAANLAKGIGSASLSFLGLRGATLAAGGAFLTGAAAVLAFGRALQTATQFETSLNVFEAQADATAEQMERIREVSIALGTDLRLPGVTANSAADALAQLGRAGLSVESSIAGVRGTLQLATAAAIDNETAVTLVASALNAFQLSGANATKVADLLAAASKESQGNIVDMGLSLQQSAAAAAQAGVSLEDTVALLTQLGRAGLRGSDAGTSLRVAILRLIAPTKIAKEALDGLGVAIRDAQGNLRVEAFAEISDQLARLGKEQRDATLALIFGQDAFRAAAILGREGATGLNEMREATQEQGVAAELAAARTQGLAGSVENLKNQIQEFGRGIGESASGPVGDLVDIFAGGIENINAFVGFLEELGDETPRAEKSISELADEFERLNREAGGSGTHEQAVARVNELGAAGARAVLDFSDLVQEAGKMNRAFSEREGIELVKDDFNDFRQIVRDAGTAGQGLRDDVEELNSALEDSAPAALVARDGIEEWRSSLTGAAIDTQALINAIQPPEGFLLPTPQFVQPPISAGARLEGDAAIAAAEGDLDELLKIQIAQRDAARKAFREFKGSAEEREKLFNEMREAEADVISTQRQIQRERAQANKAAAAEAERNAKDAEKNFLQQLENARNAQANRGAQAAITQGVQDDIREAKKQQELIKKQIAQVKSSSISEAAKQQAILELNKELIATNAAIKQLEQTALDQRKEAFDAALALAQAEQNIDAQIKLINGRIAGINKLIAAGKAEGAALNRLKAERESLKQQREELQDQRRQDQTDLAQSIFDLTGNENPLLRALDAQIADTRADIRAAKAAGKETVRLETELNKLLKQRRDVQLGGSGTGKSLAEFLTENAELFARTASNIGTVGVDPLSSFDFSQSIVATTKRLQDAAKASQPSQQQQSQQNRLPDAIDRLIAALDANTAATSGNTSSGTGMNKYATVTGQRAQAMADFWQAQQARNMEQARFDGGGGV